MPRGRPKKVLTEEEKRKLENRKRVRAIILKLLTHIESRKIVWIIETSIVKKWIKQYGFEFVEQFNLPDFLSEVDSLRPMTSAWGISHLEKMFRLWEYTNQEKNKTPTLTTEKIGTDSQISSKPKNLKSFLNS